MDCATLEFSAVELLPLEKAAAGCQRPSESLKQKKTMMIMTLYAPNLSASQPESHWPMVEVEL